MHLIRILRSELLPKQFAGTPVKAKVAATSTLATALQKVGIEPDAVQEIAEFCVGRVYCFTLTIEVCICVDLDGFVRVDILEEPFELNGCCQVIVLLWDAADEKGFRLISGLDFYLRKENCYRNHLRNMCCQTTQHRVLIFV